MRSEHALKICALRYLCNNADAAGEQQMRLSNTAYAYFPLCKLHKGLYDLLGEDRFRERFGPWLFPETSSKEVSPRRVEARRKR